jgi:hypothetical protein
MNWVKKIYDIFSRIGAPAGASVSADVAVIDGIVDTVNTNTDTKVMGRAQIKATTIDLHQSADTYDLLTGTTADVVIEALIFSPRVDVSDDVGGITGVSIQTDDTTPQVLIGSAEGVIANLTAYAQLAWTGDVLLRTGKKIQLTLIGGTADADPTTCDVVVVCRAVTSGGYLA